MALMFKLLVLAAIHVALFICYPDTGPRGNYFLVLSLIVWSLVIFALSGSIKVLQLLTKGLLLLFYAAVFACIAASTAMVMPQSDKTSVFAKLKKRDFPTVETMRRGLTRFGVKLDKQVRKEVKAADSRIEDAVDKLKGN